MWAEFKALSIGAKLGLIGGILGILLTILGSTYYIGYTKGNNNSKVAIAQYQAKVSDLTVKLKTATGKVDIQHVTEYKDRVQVVTQTVTKNHEVIKYRVPEQFKFSNGWVYAYNQSVQGLPIDPAKASDDTASWVSDRAGLDYVNENNGIALANAAQLDSLIGDIKAREAAVDEVNNAK